MKNILEKLAESKF